MTVVSDDIFQHRQWLRLAYYGALESPDTSTQNGALLIDPWGNPMMMTLACNTFPIGVDGTLPERMERPLKYACIEHAERNSIYAAARLGICTRGMTMAAAWAACADCGRAIIQAGIARLIRHMPKSLADNPRWMESIAQADQMMLEASIEIINIDTELGDCQQVRRDGVLWTP
jgi:dCMP deaminase